VIRRETLQGKGVRRSMKKKAKKKKK